MRQRLFLAALLAAAAVVCPAQATVQNSASSASYSCDGTTTVYSVTFPYLAAADLIATSTTAAGVATTLVLSSDFSVSPSAAPATGTLTLAAGSKCPSGSILKIARNMLLVQPASFRGQGPYLPATHETAFDRLEMQLQQVQAGVANPVLPSALTNATPVTATGTTTAVQIKDWLAAPCLHAKGFGVVGDGVTDDTATFTAAAAAAVAAHRPLCLGDLKIYLSSQAASISTDGLVLIGNGYIDRYNVALGNNSNNSSNWDIEKPTASLATQWDLVRGFLNASNAAVIYSKFNGPIFTGKAIAGRGFTVIGYPGNASNSAFVQTTPTSYPGWSQCVRDLRDVGLFYFGSHGIWCKGGLELTNLHNVQIGHVKGHDLYVTQTVGVNSPLDYVEIDGGGYINGLLGNITFDGIIKHIDIHDTDLSGAGQLQRRCDVTYGDKTCAAPVGAGTFPALETDLVYGIYLRAQPSTQADVAIVDNIKIHKNYAEWTNAVAKLDVATAKASLIGYKNVEVTDNFLLAYITGGMKHMLAVNERVFTLLTGRNFMPTGPVFWFDATRFATSYNLSIGEMAEDDIVATYDNYAPTGVQMARTSISYTSFTGETVAHNTETRLYFDTLQYELYVAAVTNPTTTSWTYTAPSPGLYKVGAMCGFNSANAGAAGTTYVIALYVNGSLKRYGDRLNGVTNVGSAIHLGLNATVALNKGDTAWVTLFQNSGSTVTMLGNSANNFINIDRIASF